MSCGKAAFDYISQNVECNDDIANSQPKPRRSQCIRKINPVYFDSDYVQGENVRTRLVMRMMCI